MSLINQMLRDLEQRNNQTPRSAQTLEVRTASPRGGRKLSRLWLLALICLPAAYVWQQNQTQLSASQPAAPVITAAITEPNRTAAATDTTAAVEPRQPAAASVEIPASTPSLSPEKPHQPAIARKIAKGLPKSAAANLPEKTAPVPQPAKTATPREQAEQLYRQAQRSASMLMTKESLLEALAIDPSHLPARTLLLQTLLKAHAPAAELNAFVEDSLRLFPNNPAFIKTRAHLYVQQKNFAEAVNLLERIDADTVGDSAYLALLAAGYQQLQRFPQAARIYRQLTEIQPDKAENWLGLAIAQDKLNQSSSAAQAYQQALDKKTLSAEVVSYINQRLSALTR